MHVEVGEDVQEDVDGEVVDAEARAGGRPRSAARAAGLHAGLDGRGGDFEAEGGAGEGALVAGVFTLGDLQVSDVMVPRVDVVGVERDTPWAEVVARVRSAEMRWMPDLRGLEGLVDGAVPETEAGGWVEIEFVRLLDAV